jgi:hypothetical protein
VACHFTQARRVRLLRSKIALEEVIPDAFPDLSSKLTGFPKRHNERNFRSVLSAAEIGELCDLVIATFKGDFKATRQEFFLGAAQP